MRKRWWILSGLFVIWMFLSTAILSSIVNRNVNIKKLSSMPYDTQETLYYWIDDFSISEDLWDTVSVYGWLVGLSEESQGTKTTSLIFKSDHNIYKVEAETFGWANELQFLNDKGLNITDKNIRYGITFSPLQFKNGVYQLFLYWQKGANDAGLIATDIFIKKESEGTYFYDKFSQKVALPTQIAPTQNDGYGWVDTIKYEGTQGVLKINGWAFLDEMDSTYQQVYIGVKKADSMDYYEAFPHSRIDLVGYQENTACQNSGFSANIHVENEIVPERDIVIYVFNGDKWFSFSPSMSIE